MENLEEVKKPALENSEEVEAAKAMPKSDAEVVKSNKDHTPDINTEALGDSDINVVKQSDTDKNAEDIEDVKCEVKDESPETIENDDADDNKTGDGYQTKGSKTIPIDEEKDLDHTVAKEEGEGASNSAGLDEYMYTQRNEFTSELYKLSITGLPKKFGFKEFKKKLSKLDVNPVKLKVWNDICFVTFRNNEEKESAMAKINGLNWRGKELKATSYRNCLDAITSEFLDLHAADSFPNQRWKTARPAADPLMRKRRQDQRQDVADGNKKAKMADDGLTPGERLKNSVTPLWKLEYTEQLKTKSEELRGWMKRYHRQLEHNCPDLRSWLLGRKRELGAMPCPLLDILPSPVTDGYRNKCEFTIGPGEDDTEGGVVGFRYGTYAQGTVCVGSPLEVAFLPDTMKPLVKAFQAYLLESSYAAFHPEDHSGYWRQLTVRCTRLHHLMILIDFHPQTLLQADIEAEQEKLKQYFSEGAGRSCGVTSCYMRAVTDKTTASDKPYNLVFGSQTITESLLGMKFQISPSAFFQVNTEAAEVLYRQVAEWCEPKPGTKVLDVCCGTGTIGLTVAKDVDKVIGIEMCADAIKDAKINAELNGITNVVYHCAKAEDVMKGITRSIQRDEEVVAIVDPPRSGLHSSVVVAIRNCRSINRLVYVSCNVNGALNNLIDLVRPESKRLTGPRFYPVKAIPVDLFPHTSHCEMVLLFDRKDPCARENNQEQCSD